MRASILGAGSLLAAASTGANRSGRLFLWSGRKQVELIRVRLVRSRLALADLRRRLPPFLLGAFVVVGILRDARLALLGWCALPRATASRAEQRRVGGSV